MTEKNTIPLGLSPKLVKDSAAVTEEFAKQGSAVKSLVQDLKEMQRVMKALQQASIVGGAPGSKGNSGVQAFLAGQQFRDEQRINATRRLGTEMGRNLEIQKNTLRLASDGLKYLEKEQIIRLAMGRQLKVSERTIGRISDQTKLQEGLEAAKLRLGWAAVQNDQKRVNKAQEVVRLYQERISQLKVEAAEQKRLEQIENRRAQKMTDTQLVERSRKLQMQRLFGDGGASLFAVQAGVMANYAVMNSARNGVGNAGQFTANLDLAMHNLQAITRTTDGNMQGLRDTLIDVSEETKFTAVEIANMAVTLGQAGLSTSEIVDAARAVSLLATATGTDLARAVDIATAVLGVFNLESSQMANVANVMTEAVNSSKLNLEKLTLGLQYSGNIAAQSGIRFDELTAALGAMANSGIRSGSTLGTGMRQILIALQDPSKELRETMDRLGITMSDIDVRSQGLYGALANLRDAGFSSGDAIRTMQVRAAAAYNALAGNLDQMIDLEEAFQGTSAAAQANTTQMKSFSNQMARLGSVAGSVASTGLEPILLMLRDLASATSDALEWLSNYPGVLRAVTTAAVALGAGFLTWKLGALAVGLGRLVGNLRTTRIAMRGVTAQSVLTGQAFGTMSRNIGRMQAATKSGSAGLGIMKLGLQAMKGTLVTAIISLGISALSFKAMNREVEDTNTLLDNSRSAFDRATGKVDELGTSIGMLDDKVSELLNRYDRLKTDQRLLTAEIASVKSQFVDMGLDISNVGDTVDALIANLRALRAEMAKEYVAQIRLSMAELGALQNQVKRGRANQAADFANTSTNAPMLQDFIKSNFGLGLGASAQNLADPTASLDSVRMAMVDIVTLINQTNDRLDQGGLTSFAEGRLRDFLELLKELESKGNELRDTAQEQARLNRVADDNRRDLRIAEERARPNVADIYAGAEISAINSKRRMEAASLRAPKGDTLAQFEEMNNEAQSLYAEQDALRTRLYALVQSGQLSRETQQEVETLLNQAQGEVAAQMETISAAAGKVDEQLEANDLRRLSAKLQEAKANISSSSNTEETQMWLTEFNNLLAAYEEGRRKQIQNSTEDLSLKGSELEDLEIELDQLMEDALGDFDKNLQKIGDAAQAKELEILKAEESAADAAMERAKDLAEATEDLVEQHRLKEEALVQLKRKLAAMLAIIGIELADNPEAAALATDKANLEFESDEDDIEGIGNDDKKKKRGGRKEDPIRKWIEAASSQISAVNTGIAEKFFTTGRGVDTIEDVVEKARGHMAGVTSEIQALRGRILNGTLTAKEQERLNELVSQHGNLTRFVTDQERELVALKYQQGDAMGALKLQVEQWVESNGTMADMLTSGLSGTLNTLTNSLGDFFSSITDGTKRGREAFADLARGVLKSIQQMFAKMLALYLLQKLMGFASPGMDTTPFLGEPISFGRKAAGGEVRTGLARDAGNFKLMDGEFVMRRSAVQAIGVDNLRQMNAMGNTLVDTSGHSGVAEGGKSSGKPGTMNIYLVDERSQAGSLGPADILAVVTDDIARGGTTKKLIKSVQTGAI